jgi:hypothetical protein
MASADPRSRRSATVPVTAVLPVTVAAAVLFVAVVAGALLIWPAAAQAAGAKPKLTVTPAAFSPNGDKVKDRVAVQVRLPLAGKLFVGVYGPTCSSPSLRLP